MTRFIGLLLTIIMILNVASMGWAQTSEPLPEDTSKSEPADTTESQPVETSEPTPAETEQSPSGIECELKGKEDGRSMDAIGSFVGGLAGGVLLGLIGTGIAYVAQGRSDPPVDKVRALQGDYCRLIYTDAYKTASKGKKRSMALWGGLLGTVAFVVIYSASTS